MSIKYETSKGIIVKTNVLSIPENIPIILNPEECLKILKTANEIIVQNPINVQRIIDIIEIAGELSRYGMDVSRILQSNLRAQKQFNRINEGDSL